MVEPPIKPTEDELAVLTALTAMDAKIRAAAPHLGQSPGDGLTSWLTAIVQRETGHDL